MIVKASTRDLISCVDCGSDNIGAAWSGSGELRLTWCHRCKATRTPEALSAPASAQIGAAPDHDLAELN